MIVPVDETNLLQAATIHSISWKESHRVFCTPDFIETHTPDRQREYLRNKMNNGTKLYMLIEEKPTGVVSVTKGLIEDLYILPDMQNMGYLSYIKNNKRLFRTATENAAVLGMDKSYEKMFRHVFTPILDRYGVLPQDRPYIMAFYIRGLMAIISEWLKNDCTDSITYVTGVIQQCVKMPQSETMNAV